jgi:MFS family permease
MSPIARAKRSIQRYGTRTFASLGVRNYRLYFAGQAISLTGSWMQVVAQSWLVLHLTGSGTALGSVTALQFLPMLLLAPYGGVIAGRFSKRRLLFATQAASGLLALTLGLLVTTGAIQLWMVYVLAACLGCVNAIDNPTRQAFVHDMVGPSQLRNAVALNSIEVNLSRVVGPAIAGVVIVALGLGPCFLVNAASYVAVLVCLYLMSHEELHRSEALERRRGQLVEGFVYAMKTPTVRVVLIMMAIIGTFTYEFSVTLPLMARFAFNGGAGVNAWLMSALGVGAVIGGLVTAGRGKADVRELSISALGFGLGTAAVAASPTLPVALGAMVITGLFSLRFTALCNTILQLKSDESMRTRVMAMWAVAFLGSTFFGAPIVGWIGEHVGPRWSLGVGGVAGVIAAGVGLLAVRAAARARATSREEHGGVAAITPAEERTPL